MEWFLCYYFKNI